MNSLLLLCVAMATAVVVVMGEATVHCPTTMSVDEVNVLLEEMKSCKQRVEAENKTMVYRSCPNPLPQCIQNGTFAYMFLQWKCWYAQCLSQFGNPSVEQVQARAQDLARCCDQARKLSTPEDNLAICSPDPIKYTGCWDSTGYLHCLHLGRKIDLEACLKFVLRKTKQVV